MTCRVPTSPLTPAAPPTSDKDSKKDDDDDNEEKKAGGNGFSALDSGEPSYTPLTFALQGTLQRSHLHIWTDMNVLVHNIASKPEMEKKKNKRKPKQASPGYVVAGTAYSLPEFDAARLLKDQKSSSTREKAEKAAVAVSGAAHEPWTAGHGTKVIRGEPLTFTFHVSWVEGGRGIGWPFGSSSLSLPSSSDVETSGAGLFFSRLFFFGLAASVGAMTALYWERRRRMGWRGDGILGAPSSSFSRKSPTGIVYGNSGRTNGYGGYTSTSSSSGMGNGYGGFASGKRD